MAKHIIDTLQSHLNSYCLPGQTSPFLVDKIKTDIQLDGNRVRVILAAEKAHLAALSAHQEALKAELQQLVPDYEVQLLLTHHAAPKPTAKAAPMKPEKFKLPHIKTLLAVTSGKGGVGKSLVAVNLALALKAQGLKVGLLDLDIYGPSVPTMLNLSQEPEKEAGKLKPLEYKGMPVLSMGSIIPPEKAVIWRGPLIQKAVQQLLVEAAWPELDVLVLDTPPGTGDVHLSLAQLVPLTGVVVVSTPQKLALIDAQKSIEMFHTLKVPVLGLVENMAAVSCPSCGSAMALFPSGAIDALSQKEQIPVLARLPLLPALRESADQGVPIVEAGLVPEVDEIFHQFAKKVTGVLI